jgi:hypothetical protein
LFLGAIPDLFGRLTIVGMRKLEDGVVARFFGAEPHRLEDNGGRVREEVVIEAEPYRR